MLLLSEKDIASIFKMEEAIEAVKDAFVMLSLGRVEAPLRVSLSAAPAAGTFLFMPSYSDELEAAALKAVAVFPGNSEKGLPVTPAQVFLLDGNTGMTLALLDGTYLTRVRTGAASGAAFDLLGLADARIGALIGAGGQAPEQLIAMVTARDLDELRVYDKDHDKLKQLVESMTERLASTNTRIIAANQSDEAIEDADLITLVTPSTTPVIDGSKVKPGAVVSCVGAYQHHMQELDPVVLERAGKIYFDSKDAVLSESGDILIPLEEGRISESDFTGNLGDLILGRIPGREDNDEIIVFETVGTAAQDLVTAKRIYERALATDKGTRWE